MYINPRIVMLKCDFPPEAMGEQVYNAEDYCGLLPQQARAAGFKLYDVSYGTDPLILYDKRGHILKIWDRYKPTMAEIGTACRSFV